MFLSKSEGNDNLFLERRKAGTGEPRIQKDRTTPEGPPQRFCRFPPNPGGTMGRDTLFLLSESQTPDSARRTRKRFGPARPLRSATRSRRDSSVPFCSNALEDIGGCAGRKRVMGPRNHR